MAIEEHAVPAPAEDVVDDEWERDPNDFSTAEFLCDAIMNRAPELLRCDCGKEYFPHWRETTLVFEPTCKHEAEPLLIARRIEEKLGPSPIAIHYPRTLNSLLPPSQLAPKAVGQLISYNGRDPVLFQRGRKLVKVQDGRLVELKAVDLTLLLAEATRWRKEPEPPEGAAVWWPEQSAGPFVDPPSAVVHMVLKMGQYGRVARIPEIARVVTVPVLCPDGSLVTRPGYQSESCSYYAPAVEVELPEMVSRTDLEEARDLLQVELLGDFSFAEQADRAASLGAMLVPFVRDLIRGPTPLHLIDKPEAGTGAGLLAGCIAMPAAGPNLASSQWSRSEEERRKAIYSVLLEGRSVVLWDNVEGKISSPTLNSMLTQPIYSDRKLNTNDVGGLPVRCLHLMTANNGRPVGDTVRRVVPIRLDARVEYPAERTGPAPGQIWRHPDLLAWAEQHRAELVDACLKLILWWTQEGRPLAPLTGFGSYESYEQVVGGILGCAGIEGFLANRLRPEDVDEERAAYSGLLCRWEEIFGSEPVTAKDVVRDERMRSCLEELGISPGEQHAPQMLGNLLAKNRDAIREGRKIARGARANSGGFKWRVVVA